MWYYRGAGTPKRDFARRHDIIFRYGFPSRYFNPDAARQPYSPATVERFSHYIGNVRGDSDYGPQALNPKGKHPDDVIIDIQPVAPSAKARIGYPTQKPIALLERIIKSSSKEGDIVLDPFYGSATTCIAAENNNRQWIGIDVSQKAYDVVKLRLDKEVARTHELPTFREEVHLRASPPRRTGIGAGVKETKHVYVISNPKYRGRYKVGIAKNVQTRLTAYQTGDPDRRYKLEFSYETHLFREIEAHIHEHFENEMEWVSEDLKAIKREIRNFADGASFKS